MFVFLFIVKHSATKAPPSEKLEAKICFWRNKWCVEKTICLVSCLLPCCFSSCLLLFSKHVRTGLSCLCRNLSKTIAHWQTSFQSILSQTSTLENILLKTVLFTNTVNLPVESLLQQHLCLAQGLLKTFFVLFATKQDLLGFVYQVLSDLCWF